MTRLFPSILALMVTAGSAQAMDRLTDRSAFAQAVTGKTLSRLGINLQVTPSGEIQGKAFGKPVTGEWQWRGGYFCRTMAFDGESLGANCQVVEVNGRKIRFTADEGRGDFADFTLR